MRKESNRNLRLKRSMPYTYCLYLFILFYRMKTMLLGLAFCLDIIQLETVVSVNLMHVCRLVQLCQCCPYLVKIEKSSPDFGIIEARQGYDVVQ